MKIDDYGIPYFTEEESIELLYSNRKMDLSSLVLEDPSDFNKSNKETYSEYPTIKKYEKPSVSVTEFHKSKSSEWFIPDEYKKFDIKTFLMEKCSTETEKNRMKQELSYFQETNSINVLLFAKYFVDTLTKHKKVWGVGRGSNTASLALYKLGLHSIDPIAWDIPIEEFFKNT